MTMLAELVEVVIGVDTHKHTHTAAVVHAVTGAVLTQVTVTADPAGFAELDTLAAQHSGMRAWALEGSGGYGAGLARHLAEHGETVIEIDRPVRPKRRSGAKSDPIDAVRAARDALARTQLAQPKSGAERAALQMHLTARRAAVEASADAQRQLHALVVTAPERIRAKFRGQTTRAIITTAHALRAPHRGDAELVAAIAVLRALARRIRFLDGCRDESAFAMLAGAAPIPASSGQTVRYRLNRSGDRQLNRALHTVALSRLQRDERTRTYADRRRAQGKTDREIKRCLKRYIARELYRRLESPPVAA